MQHFKLNVLTRIALSLFFGLAGSAALASDTKLSVSVSIESQDDSSEAKTYAFSLEAEINLLLLKEGATVFGKSGPSEELFSISGGVYVSGAGRMTIKTELSDLATGKVIWAESYNRNIGPEVDGVASDVVNNAISRMTGTRS